MRCSSTVRLLLSTASSSKTRRTTSKQTFVAAIRYLSAQASSSSSAASALPEREQVEYDVVIVGAGPAGLSAAIRLKQNASTHGKEVSVCVVEKGHEVGAHILSGNVFEPRALNELIPNWKEKGAPLNTPAKEDAFLFLTEKSSFKLPFVPPMLHNDGNYVCSLSQVVRWLGKEAEELGVEIFPATPASEVLYAPSSSSSSSSSSKEHVIGIATADAGIGKDHKPKRSFARGMAILGKQTLFAEGARGSCTEDLEKKFNLRANCDPQTYGLGVKEVWRIPSNKLRPGFIQHTLGWPLPSNVYGGSFLYHMEPDLVLLGLVVGLDYANPYISPYAEFQRWKHHPDVAKHLEGGECLAYGARVINEGGLQSIPKLTFPGGALIGCTAGFLNVPKIKGTHTAMKSGMVAADSVYEALTNASSATSSSTDGVEVTDYAKNLEKSWVYEELKSVRNYHPSFKAGLLPGVAYSGLSAYILRGKEPWTFRNSVRDSEKTEPAAKHTPIDYPRPDGKLSFDLLSNLARSGTNHEHDQPSHLRVRKGMETVPSEVSYTVYAAPESRFCPAKVYEYPDPVEKKLVINAQNCLHCKACAIKTPKEYIKWTTPEAGGGGPQYELL